MPYSTQIWAFIQNSEILTIDIDPERLKVIEFDAQIPEFKEFKSQHKAPEEPYNFRFDIVRFAHKVFCIDFGIKAEHSPTTQRLIWMDADTFCFRPIPSNFWNRLLPEGIDFSYLGREHLLKISPELVDISYPECGFMMFARTAAIRKFWGEIMLVYRENRFSDFAEYHDSFIINQVMKEKIRNKQLNTFDITSLGIIPISKPSHVFAASILGYFIDHKKGNRKNQKFSPELLERFNNEKRIRDMSKNS